MAKKENQTPTPFDLIDSDPNKVVSPEGGTVKVNNETLTPFDLYESQLSGFRGVNNVDELKRLGSNYVTNAGDETIRLATTQPLSEQVKNMVVGSVPNFTAGLLDNFNYDIPDIINLWQNKEKDYGSWLSNITRDLRETSQDFIIYQEGDSFSDPAYWMNQGKNLSYSAGLMVGMLGEQWALSSLTTATLGATAGLQSASALSKINLITGALYGSAKGVHEGYINALETFDQTKKKYENLGYSADQAIEYASQAAALGYKMEVGPLMALNALQFATIGKYNPFSKQGRGLNQGYSGAVEGLTDMAFKGIKNRKLRTAIDYTINAGSESIEEGIQEGISKYSQYKVGKDAKEVFGDFELFDTELRDAMVGGALGGLLFAGLGNARNYLQRKSINSEYGKWHDQFIIGVGKRVNKDLTNLKEAFDEGNQERIDSLRYKIQKSNVFDALKLDYVNQKETAFESYVSELQAVLDAASSKDVEKLKQFGIENVDDLNYITENFPKYINDANKTKQSLIKNLSQIDDFSIAATITDSEQVLNHSIEYQNRSNRLIEGVKTSSPIYQDLNDDGKQEFELVSETISLLNKAKNDGLNKNQVKRLEALKKDTSDLREREDFDSNFSEEILGTELGAEVINNLYSNLKLQDVKEEALNRIKYWKNKDNIREFKTKKAKEKISNAKNRKELEKAKKDLEEQGELTEELNEKINVESEKADIKQRPESEDQNKVSIPDNAKTVNQEDLDNTARNLEKLLSLSSEEVNVIKKDSTESKKDEIEKRLGIKLPTKNTSIPVSSKTWGNRKSLANKISSELKGVVERGMSMQDWLDKGYARQLSTWTNETILEFLEVADIERRRQEELNNPLIAVRNAKNRKELIQAAEEWIGVNPYDDGATSMGVRSLLMTPGDFERGKQAFIDENKKTSEIRDKQINAKYDAELTALNESENYTEAENDDLFEPLEINNMSDDLLSRLEEGVRDYYELMKEENGVAPTFREFAKDFVERRGRENTDKIYNALVEGWKRNNYPLVDFTKAYNEIFKDKDTISGDLLNIGLEMVGPQSREEVSESNNKILEQVRKENSDVVELDDNNRPAVIHTSPFKTIDSDLKASFLSVKYKRTITDNNGTKVISEEDSSTELNTSEYINQEKLLNPDLFNPGDKLTIRIPENYREIIVKSWKDDFTSGPRTNFEDWARINDIEEGSEEWINKIPMIAYDKDGEGVFFIHDSEWYNLTNVGSAENPKEQSRIIAEAKEKLFSLREKVYSEGNINIEITEKNPGSWVEIEKDQPAITLNEANPDTQLAVAGDQGVLYLNGNEIFEKGNISLGNIKNFKIGNTYEIRRGTTKNSYIAFEVLRDKIPSDVVSTIRWATKIKLDRFNKQYEEKRNQVLNTVKYDLYDAQDYQSFLSSFIRFGNRRFEGSNNYEIASAATAFYNNYTFKDSKGEIKKLPIGMPYIFTQNFQVYFGRVGTNLVEDRQTLFLSDKSPAILNIFDDIVPEFVQNIDKTALTENRKLVIIDDNGSVIPGKNYRDYLKDNLKTNIKSFNVGTKEKPSYATIVQPTIKFKEVGVEDYSKEENYPSTESELPVTDKVTESNINTETLVSAYESLKRLGVSEDDPSMKFLKEELGEDINEDSFFSPVEELSDEEYSEIKSQILGNLNGLNIIQNYQLVDYIFNEMSSRLDFKYGSKIKTEDLLNEIDKEVLNKFKEIKKKDLETIKNLKTLLEESKNSRLELLINNIEKEVDYIDIVQKNWSIPEGTGFRDQAFEKLKLYTGIKETGPVIEQIEEASTEQENNYSRESLEEKGKDSASYRLRRFMANIKDVRPDGKIRRGFLGVPTYVGFNQVYDTIEMILSSPYEIEADFKLIERRLLDNVDNFKWLTQFIDRLTSKDTDQQIRQEFAYNMVRHNATYKFGMFSKNRNGKYTLKVYDSNANEVTRVIRNRWYENFKSGPLVRSEEGVHKVNPQKAEALLKEFKSKFEVKIKALPDERKSSKVVEIPNSELQDWLLNFGIYLSEETLDKLKTSNVDYYTQDGKVTLDFNKMFEISPNTSGIFGLMAWYLEDIIDKNKKGIDLEFDENEYNSPFKYANNILKTLARLESRYNSYTTTKTFRDGGKTFSGITPKKFATDTVWKLKFDEEYRSQLGNKSFNKHSYLLDLLNNDVTFRESKFEISHIGNTSIKELGKRVFGDTSISSLSDIDHELLKLILFQDQDQGEMKGSWNNENFINYRIARMFFPTMSDKSQMLSLSTAVLDIKKKHLLDDISKPKDELLEIIYSQLVRPELERMTSFYKNIRETNITGYDTGAKLFLFLPEMNNLVDSETGKRVISLMANDPNRYDFNWFENSQKENAKKIINDFVNSKVESKISSWAENGFLSQEQNSVTFLDRKYIDSRGGDNSSQNIKIAAYDYIINSLLSNANIHMTIIGDVANYAQDSKIKKYFQGGEVFLPKEEYGNKAYSLLSKDVVGINLGKRLALLLAPGSKLANSKNQQYTQLFLNDFVTITSNVETLVRLYYNEEEASKARDLVNKYNNTISLEERKDIASTLSSRYPVISDYFDIEATDAQEYTTLREHINVLWGQGRIPSEEDYNNINNKIDKQLKAEKEGKKIPNEAILNNDELKIVLQPIKPVYTGLKNEDRFDAMRMIYIKSSSFPLIPQLTKGLELDKLRRLMEKLEQNGKPVRASYQTANKVGSVKNPITPFNPDGTFNENISEEDIESASLVLERDNFRIQQDVPFKSDRKKEDKISLGTQTLKLLFGDGILNLGGFYFEGYKHTGKELYNKFVDIYDDYIDHRRKSLYKELGVDEDGQPIDIEVTMNKLGNILRKEAVERSFPKQDIEALKIIPKLDSDGKVVDLQFSIPIWLSPNSNRYESLLNAIVSNRTVNIKLPGYSLVAGTEAGFKTQTNFEGIDQSKIVYTNKWEGEIKAAEITNNKLKKAQVLLPSKFRDNKGNLIEFFDEKGNYNRTYVEQDESGMLKLKEGIIDDELLNMTSFRIPTSGHVSMSQIEVVGFLPKESGDLIIVPKNLTKQKGLDFDVDKENLYSLHTYIDNEGKIRVFNDISKERLLKGLKSKLESSRNLDDILIGEFDFDNETIDMLKSQTISIEDKISNLEDLFTQKILENKIVQVHSSILSNLNEEVQKKINKVLSMDFAKGQAELIQSKITQEEDLSTFSILSDDYQKEKMYLGSSGKMGIGVYSNYVVFHSMSQQISNPLNLMTFDEEGNRINMNLVIGNQVSDGRIGNLSTLAPSKYKRSIAEVFAERQNTATDNEKEQIMGRVNVNEVTINVDSILSLLGFDKDVLSNGKEVSIPYLLLSQPIIREYVDKVRRIKSTTTEFDPNAKDKIVQDLLLKYETDFEADSSLLTGQRMYDNLTDPENIIQSSVLSIFLTLDKYAEKIGNLQNRLNINRSGLGRSFFDVIDKYEAIDSIKGKYNRLINNASDLIGDYISKEDVNEFEIQELKSEGYVEFENNLVKPNTPVGSMLVRSVKTGYDLWERHYIHENPFVKKSINEVLGQITGEDTKEAKMVELKERIFKDMKKYFLSSNRLGVFNEDPQKERYRLYFDTEDNKSLSSYLKDLTSSKENFADVLKSNKLLSRFEYSVNKNGLPSLIKFDYTGNESFDEDYLYLSLIELMDQNIKLPDFNGESYSTRKLAQDLIAYSYLGGGIQEAIQFVKYVPVTYLNTIEFGSVAREWGSRNSKRSDLLMKMLGVNNSEQLSRFANQYLLHHPESLYKIPLDIVHNPVIHNKELVEFEIHPEVLEDEKKVEEVMSNKFVSIYNPVIKKGLKKFNVYQNIGDRFVLVSPLGVFGMDEYSIRKDSVKSLVNGANPIAKPENDVKTFYKTEGMSDVFGVKTNNINTVIDNISSYSFTDLPYLSSIASAISKYIPSNLSIRIVDFKEEFGVSNASGRYKNGVIHIDSSYFYKGNNSALAKTIVHETVHALTSNYLEKYMNKDGSLKVEDTPKEVTNLIIMYNKAVKALGQERINQVKNDFESGNILTREQRNIDYGLINPHEFMTFIMVEPEFQQYMKTISYSPDKSIFDKFVEVIDSILRKVFGEDYGLNNLTSEGIRGTLSIIENQYQETQKNKYEQMNENDRVLESFLKGELDLPTIDDYLSDEENNEPLDNIEDPFKCK